MVCIIIYMYMQLLFARPLFPFWLGSGDLVSKEHLSPKKLTAPTGIPRPLTAFQWYTPPMAHFSVCNIEVEGRG